MVGRAQEPVRHIIERYTDLARFLEDIRPGQLTLEEIAELADEEWGQDRT